MTYTQLRDNAQMFESVLALERYIPHRARLILIALTVVSAGACVGYVLFGSEVGRQYAGGGFFLSVAVLFVASALEAFSNSFYFYGSRAYTQTDMNYECAQLVIGTNDDDVTLGLLRSVYGRRVLRRCGFDEQTITAFEQSRNNPLSSFALTLKDPVHTAYGYLFAVTNQDDEFKRFLFEHGVSFEVFSRAGIWVERTMRFTKARRHWWSRERLASVPGIGTEWSYGKAYTLQTFSNRLVPQYPTLHEVDYFQAYVDTLEDVLVRDRTSNPLIVGDPGVGKRDIITALQKRIDARTAHDELKNYCIVHVDIARVRAETSTRDEFEKILSRILEEAGDAGNIILALSVSEMLRAGNEYETDILPFLNASLASEELHIIGYADTDQFHSELERHESTMRHFERIILDEGHERITARILEDEAVRAERKRGVYFTYQSIAVVARSAHQYFTREAVVHQALDFLHELAQRARENKKDIITEDDARAIVERYTGIPVTSVGEGERDTLLNLEDRLHEYVIGQNEAITAISDALRRARSGLTNPDRPLGSFLFLGPTGVGKTQTTKALARVFFGDGKEVMRFDMSEYSGPQAVSKLIGSHDGSTPGVLVSRLRDHPYGVIHLDEFEKASREAVHLFLQVLDEGLFSDARGKEVNARNTIIIATSNAGSDLIFDYMSSGGSAHQYKDTIVNTIVKRKTFSPELLNRFDGIVLFHPLSVDELKQIARLLLEDLNDRLKQKSMHLEITSELVNYIAEKGTDPKFGARPLRRAIQDSVENVIARKVVDGSVVAGQRIVLDPSEWQQADAVPSIGATEPETNSAPADEYTFGFSDEEK